MAGPNHRYLAKRVHLKIDLNCCRVMTTLAQGDYQYLGIFAPQRSTTGVNVGVYASVLQGGMIRRGDSVWLESCSIRKHHQQFVDRTDISGR